MVKKVTFQINFKLENYGFIHIERWRIPSQICCCIILIHILWNCFLFHAMWFQFINYMLHLDSFQLICQVILLFEIWQSLIIGPHNDFVCYQEKVELCDWHVQLSMLLYGKPKMSWHNLYIFHKPHYIFLPLKAALLYRILFKKLDSKRQNPSGIFPETAARWVFLLRALPSTPVLLMKR